MHLSATLNRDGYTILALLPLAAVSRNDRLADKCTQQIHDPLDAFFARAKRHALTVDEGIEISNGRHIVAEAGKSALWPEVVDDPLRVLFDFQRWCHGARCRMKRAVK